MTNLDNNDSPPDVLVLIGPFVDAKHTVFQKGDIGMTYGELFEAVLRPLIQLATRRKVELILVP